MLLNKHGMIVERAWIDLPRHYPNIELEVFCIMPNHVHGIILINDDRRGGSSIKGETSANITIELQGLHPGNHATRPYISSSAIKRAGEKSHGVSEIVRAFKSFSARRINDVRNMHGVPVWQRSFYDHIIRGELDHKNILEYIQINPQNWQKDQFF